MEENRSATPHSRSSEAGLKTDPSDRSAELSRAYEELQRRNDAFQHELAMARRVQATFIPQEKDFPDRDEISFRGFYEAMADVGGDLYDVVRIGKNAYGLIIADVSGHGVAAALVTALVKVAFRARMAFGVRTDEICASVNASIYEILGGGERYVTAFVATINLETGTLEYTNAAHHPALLVRAGMAVKLDTEGGFMGIFEKPHFGRSSVALVPGDRIVLYTDGIVESRSFMGGEYGLERLENVVKADASVKPADIVASLISDMDAFTMGAPAHDDRAFLCVSYLGKASELRLGRGAPGGRAAEARPGDAAGDFSLLAKRSASMDAASALVSWRLHLAAHPDDHRALNNIGVLLHRLGKDAEAAVSFRRALILAPGDRRILRNLALVSDGRSDI